MVVVRQRLNSLLFNLHDVIHDYGIFTVIKGVFKGGGSGGSNSPKFSDFFLKVKEKKGCGGGVPLNIFLGLIYFRVELRYFQGGLRNFRGGGGGGVEKFLGGGGGLRNFFFGWG